MPNPFMRALSGVLAVFTMAAVSCSQKPSDSSPNPSSSAAQCKLHLSGNALGSFEVPLCATLSSTDDAGVPDYSLGYQVQDPQIPNLDIAIDLGAAPTPDAFSSESASAWSVNGQTAAGCAIVAGSTSARMGSFTLTLSSLGVADGGAASAPHGSLELTAYIEAQPGMDCGVSDLETIQIDF